MRVSLKWLADYVDVTLPPAELAHRLTMAGLEVQAIERIGGDWDEALVTVGLVTAVEPHPNADRLRLATVDLGGETMTVVCGAPNVAAGQRIAFARAGATLIDGRSGKPAELKPATIRGVESSGMVLSEKELGMSDEHEGIIVLPDGTPLGVPLARVLGDTILDIDLKPNRPDCLSMLGVAREVAALTGQTAREPGHTYEELDDPVAAEAAVEIADSDLCARYIGTVIKDVRIGESPRWMQERLIACGMRPINNVVDITNYVMLEVGQPLHAFDYDKLGDHRIVVRRPRPGEKLVTLDGTEQALTPDMLAICDAESPIALAGVMGGLDSEVTERTTNILLESANFNPVSIRRTATALKSRTEASTRFEKGLGPELARIGALRATKLLVEIAGGKALHGLIDVYPLPSREVRLDVTRKRLHQVLGIDPPTSQVRSVLTSLGFGCKWEPPDHYQVRAPYWRTDIHIPDDIAEEVARIIGYDTIPTRGLTGEVPPLAPQPRRELRERVKRTLAAAGMQEVITYSLTTLEALKRVVPPEELAIYQPLRAQSPLSSQHEYARTTLRASVLEALSANARQVEGELAIFEAGRVYLPQDGDQPLEQEHVVGAVAGRHVDRWGRPTSEPVDFYDANGYLDTLFDQLGVAVAYVGTPSFALLPGRAADLQVEGRRVGTIGQLHPQVAGEFDIDEDVFLFELVLDELLPAIGGTREYRTFSRFPAVARDLALLVDRRTPAERVRALIEEHELVQAARLFDVYEGDRVAAGKKSLAFSVLYQSPDHTLTDDEVTAVQRSLLERLRSDLGAELRGG